MMPLFYLVPLVAWLAFVQVQFHKGDRPVSVGWFALMAGLGTFECAEAFFALFEPLPALSMALGAAVLAGGCVLAAQSRQAYRVGQTGSHRAVAAG
jgi:hypothetical protein